MDERRSEIVSAVLVIVAMLLLVVPRVAVSTNDPIPSLLGVDVLVLVAVAIIILALGNIARHVRTAG